MTFRRSPSPSLSEIDDDFTAFLESFRPGGTDKPRRRSSGEDPKVVTALGRFASWNDDGPALALVEAAQSRISELLAQMPTPSVKSAPPRKDSQGLARRSTRSLVSTSSEFADLQ